MRSAIEQHLYSRHQTTGRVGYFWRRSLKKYVETGRPEGLGVQPPILEVCLAAFAIAFDRLNHTRASRRQPRKRLAAEELCAEAACHPRLGGVDEIDRGRRAQQFFSQKITSAAEYTH